MANPLSSTLSLACPFLGHLSPTQLVTLLTRWANKYDSYLNPIWLNNEGQNIIGFMPQRSFYLLPPVTNTGTSTDSLQLLTLTRKNLPNFSSLCQPIGNQTTSQASKQPNNQTTSHINNNSTSTPDLQIHLVNNQTPQGFASHLINYAQQYLADDNNTGNTLIDAHSLAKQPLNSQPDNALATSDDSCQYRHGFMGFISYDVMANELAKPNKQQQPHYFKHAQPAAFFGHYPIYLTCSTSDNIHSWQLHTTTEQTKAIIGDVQSWLKHVIKTTRPLIYKPIPISLYPRWSAEEYNQAFAQTQAYLHAGDCYQINLTQEWQGTLTTNQLADYLPKLHTYTQAPFAGYLQLTSPKSLASTQANNASQSASPATFELLSCSPELFFTFNKGADGSYQVHTKPIKGTRPRGTTEAVDQQLKNELAHSEKDLAENVMIVDLLRNDLGKYAKTGTVKVPKRFAIESYSNVHHMVSTITATLTDDIHPLEMLFGSLPAGSITGTPKKRSVEIINELEKSPRGAYCGTMGYMNFDGSGQWNVLIRTLQASLQGVSLWAGGGITVASNCADEYQECFDKVGNLLNLLAD